MSLRSERKPVAAFRILCPGCREEVPVDVLVRGIETVGLALAGVQLEGYVRHDCRRP